MFLCSYNLVAEQNHINEERFVSLPYPYGSNSDLLLCRSQQKTIINSMAVNEDGVLATAGMMFLSWR